MLPVIILLFVAWMILLLLANVLPQQLPFSFNDYLYAVGATVVILLAAYAYTELQYWNYYYEFKDTGLMISHGIIEKRVDTIPYPKIQRLRAERSVFEAMLGSVHVHIDTAGLPPSEKAPIIPGVPIEAYEELVTFIKSMTSPDRADAEEPRVFIQGARSQDELMRLMLEQLILINKKLSDANKEAKPKPLVKKNARIFKKEERHVLENLLEEEGIRTHL